MKKKCWWIAIVVLVSACGVPSVVHAEPNRFGNRNARDRFEAAQSQPLPLGQTQENIAPPLVGESHNFATLQGKSEENPGRATLASERFAKVEAYILGGQPAAILYLRDIPAIAFLGSTPEASSSKSCPTLPEVVSQVDTLSNSTANKTAVSSTLATHTIPSLVQASPPESLADPMWRASEIAAKLEQIQSRDIASAITVSWDGKVDDSGNEVAESYLIKVKDEELVRIDPQTRLPDTTNNLAEDALQITNRLRRLLGNAPPIAEIANKPKPKPVSPAEPAIAYNVQYQVDGWASWYGPGFHGRLSASGEVFNQNALTAAHLHLPFGTRVRVTNLNSGLSVVVRINDRGPYVGNRIIDLSAAAARAIGMIESGVAPVRVEILN